MKRAVKDEGNVDRLGDETRS